MTKPTTPSPINWRTVVVPSYMGLIDRTPAEQAAFELEVRTRIAKKFYGVDLNADTAADIQALNAVDIREVA